ncbi:MAG: ANTAR domain-containing protein [Faecalibacterium sp.]|nr:ANTAR domain-containing protein [Ruminococcus sp.]MCM1392698.1 ANTAR domain-containing protein [Ruminococcus sp.]MCM1486375.1 ANTAR domain-containing protein [Faecalibacterium sp.]
MRYVIVAAASQKLSGTIEKILSQGHIAVEQFCKSGSEVMAIQSDIDNAVLICGPLKDIPSIYLAKEIPDSWDMILLLSSNQPFPYYVSNITPINLPVNRLEFVETVRSVAEETSQVFAAKTTAKKVRSAEDTEIIESAKRKIMSSRGLSESDAHKLLQRYSMNLGISLVESAGRFVSE